MIDLITSDDMRDVVEHSLGHRMDTAIREWYRGIDSARFPRVTGIPVTAGTVFNLFAGNSSAPCGPSEGDVWLLRRVIVTSSVLTDGATYILFRGSSPSDPNNSYGANNLLEAFEPSGQGQPVNVGFYPSTKSILLQPGEQIYAQVLNPLGGVTYVLHGEAIRVPAEMKGKVLLCLRHGRQTPLSSIR
jgi:hypothetical protein